VDARDDEILEAMWNVGRDVDGGEREMKGLINGGSYKAVWGEQKEGVEDTIKLKPSGIMGMVNRTYTARRGYPEYNRDGEAEERQLDWDGCAGKVIFVVHGIGEEVWSKDTGIAKSLIRQCNETRVVIHKLQSERYTRKIKRWEKDGKYGKRPMIERRVEVLPVCWYEVWHKGTDTKTSVEAVTLPGIPIVRTIANSIILDVIMYMEGGLREKVLSHVSKSITDINYGYKGRNKGWGGEISLIGHSLGSVITWDICDRYMKETGNHTGPLQTPSQPTQPPPPPDQPTLPTMPKSLFLLGSPLGLFLSIRGNHPTMLGGNLWKGGMGVYNVIHGSDPVAYRVEPLLLPPSTQKKDVPSPAYIPSASGSFLNAGGLLPHNHAGKTIEDTKKKVEKYGRLAEGVFKRFAGSITGDEGKAEAVEKMEIEGVEERHSSAKFRVTEAGNDRVDWIIQSGVLEHELLSALTAHQGYLDNRDVLDFIAKRIG